MAAEPPVPQPPPVPPESVPPEQAVLLVQEGLSVPESVYYDIESDVYLVSNIAGSPLAADDNGFISKVSPEGKLLEPKWIDGAKPEVELNAPKGMTIAAGVLYVADLTVIRKFDPKTGEPKGAIKVKGATFLNDVAAGPDGTVYFTDTGIKADGENFGLSGTDAVYSLVKDKPKQLAKGKDLNGPNGVLADESGVWVVSYRGAELYKIESGKKAEVKQLPQGALDGIVKTSDGQILISSWDASAIFRVAADGAIENAVGDVKSPADIGYDSKRNRVLIPQFLENTLRIQPL